MVQSSWWVVLLACTGPQRKRAAEEGAAISLQGPWCNNRRGGGKGCSFQLAWALKQREEGGPFLVAGSSAVGNVLLGHRACTLPVGAGAAHARRWQSAVQEGAGLRQLG